MEAGQSAAEVLERLYGPGIPEGADVDDAPKSEAELFANLGIDSVPMGEGFREVMQAHARDEGERFADANSAVNGPIQLMMNSDRFRRSYAESVQSRELPWVHLDLKHALRIEGSKWNVAALEREMTSVILAFAKGSREGARGFYMNVRVIWVAPGPGDIADVHWLGIEFALGRIVPGEPRVILYDPAQGGACGSETVWRGGSEVAFGPLLRIMTTERIRTSLGWEPERIDPRDPDLWRPFGSRGEAIEKAERSILRGEVEHVDAVNRGLKLLGFEYFDPPGRACQISEGDFFCQTWVLNFFKLRSEVSSMREVRDRVEGMCLIEGGHERAISDFTREALGSRAAFEYWKATRVDRGTDEEPDVTLGEHFYWWLRWAANRPGFGFVAPPENISWVDTRRRRLRRMRQRRRFRAVRGQIAGAEADYAFGDVQPL